MPPATSTRPSSPPLPSVETGLQHITQSIASILIFNNSG